MSSRHVVRPYAEIIDELSKRNLLEGVQNIARAHGVTMYELCSGSRLKSIAAARHAAWLFQRESTGHSYPQIGAIWGYDHTSIMNGCKQARKRRHPTILLEGEEPEPKPKKKKSAPKRRRKKK